MTTLTRTPSDTPVDAEKLLGRVASVQVGRIQSHGTPAAADPVARPWRSAFIKTPVAGPVAVGPLGLEGDQQADTRHHGGPNMAVLMYSADHFPMWRAEHGLADMNPGGFGENLSVTGIAEADVCVGDRLRVGKTLVLEVSQPRQPCANINRRWGRKGVMEAVVANGKGGWYLRVIEPGPVSPGDEVRLDARPYPGLTIALANDAHYDRCRDRAAFDALLACPALNESFKRGVSAGYEKLDA